MSHHDSPANGQAVIFLTGLLEVLVVYFWINNIGQYRTTLSVIKPYKIGQIVEHKHKPVESESEKLDAEDVSFISYSKPTVLHIPQVGICIATGLRIIIKDRQAQLNLVPSSKSSNLLPVFATR